MRERELFTLRAWLSEVDHAPENSHSPNINGKHQVDVDGLEAKNTGCPEEDLGSTLSIHTRAHN